MTWIRRKSWHIISTWTRVPGRAIALCGLVIEGPEMDIFPAGERTCETCLRLDARHKET